MLCSAPGPWQGKGCSGQPVVFALPWAQKENTPFSFTTCRDILRPAGEGSPRGCCDMGPEPGRPRRVPVWQIQTRGRGKLALDPNSLTPLASEEGNYWFILGWGPGDAGVPGWWHRHVTSNRPHAGLLIQDIVKHPKGEFSPFQRGLHRVRGGGRNWKGVAGPNDPSVPGVATRGSGAAETLPRAALLPP